MTNEEMKDPLINFECGRVCLAKSARVLLSLLQGVIPSSGFEYPAAWGCHSATRPTESAEKKQAHKQAARRTGVVDGRTAPSIGMLHCDKPVSPFLARVCVAGLEIKSGRKWSYVKDPCRHADPHDYHGCQFAHAKKSKQKQMPVVVARRVPADAEVTPVVVQARRTKSQKRKAKPAHGTKHKQRRKVAARSQ